MKTYKNKSIGNTLADVVWFLNNRHKWPQKTKKILAPISIYNTFRAQCIQNIYRLCSYKVNEKYSPSMPSALPKIKVVINWSYVSCVKTWAFSRHVR